MLEVHCDRAWHGIITLDESWFCLSTDYEFVWLPRDEKVPEREQYTIQSKKFMLTIVRNPHRFHLIKILEKVASSMPAIISLRHSGYCSNGAQLKQRATSENCWRMRTMRARTPPSYQLNILTRIE
jgi:hypothetical protein